MNHCIHHKLRCREEKGGKQNKAGAARCIKGGTSTPCLQMYMYVTGERQNKQAVTHCFVPIRWDGVLVGGYGFYQ